MKRKIVQHGSSSLTLTLPIRWTEKFGLKKGDELDVEEKGTELVVSTNHQVSAPRKELHIPGRGIFTKNNLSHLYQLGYDEIEISFDDGSTLAQIKERLPDCIGYELIDQRSNRAYIKSIMTTLDCEFDTLLRKSFLVANQMAEEMMQAFASGEVGRMKDIRQMEGLNNRFTDVCIRILNKKGYSVPNRTMQMYEIVKNIERIADEFKYICDHVSEDGSNISPELIEDFRRAADYYLAFYNLFYSHDPELKKRVYLERKPLLAEFEEKLSRSSGIGSMMYHHLIILIKKSYDGAGGYFALNL